jgi:hypothetical protein
VPLHAQERGPDARLEGLDLTVLGMGDGSQVATELLHRLVVIGRDPSRAAEYPPVPAVLVDPHVVVSEDPDLWAVKSATLAFFESLIESAAVSDVDELHAATDPEHRDMEDLGCGEQLELPRIALASCSSDDACRVSPYSRASTSGPPTRMRPSTDRRLASASSDGGSSTGMARAAVRRSR